MYSYGPHLKKLVKEQLEERAERTPGPAKRPITTVKGSALVDLQFRAQVEGHSFISDERESSGGHDAGPAPMRLFVAGVMFCHKVWTIKKATQMDVHFEKLDGEISWWNDHPTPRITYKVVVESKHSDDDVKACVEEGAKKCNAFRAVEKATKIELSIEHNGKKIMEKAYGLK